MWLVRPFLLGLFRWHWGNLKLDNLDSSMTDVMSDVILGGYQLSRTVLTYTKAIKREQQE